MVDYNIFSGSETIASEWTLGPQIQTSNGSGKFDPTEITKGGFFTIDYTGTEGAIYLVFSQWDNSKWVSINTPTSTEKTEIGYTSTFSFEDCAQAFESDDFSDLNVICAGSAKAEGKTVITDISWHGYPAAPDLGETAMLFKGSKKGDSVGTNIAFFYTKHVGGEWDAAAINKDSYFYAEYLGAENGIYLAFLSASGASDWVAVYPDETGKTAEGRFYSIFKYENFSKKFGTNFKRLDQIQAYCNKNEKITLKRIAYFTGKGDPVDVNGTDTWDRADTGIAFIGDSIVQNPLVDSEHLDKKDWNGILNRTDCSNYGIGGQTTMHCAARINEPAKKHYSKAVMLCGINDIGKGYSNQQICNNFKTMFNVLKTFNPQIKIYLISVLPTTDVWYTNEQNKIVALNNDLKELTQSESNVTYVDCYSSFIGDNGYCKPQLVFDGLHPNLEGYAVIAKILNSYLD
ncbi:MAG: GDSL-type esterase/lipase family protein [Firmicutes bacterium]|nr:GDSL-type esterase/lipase family protein [[Eubacterium] siraeum]MCM1487358.1 GDSL-type esterase/lipase family protein [Bacillota bacterium]